MIMGILEETQQQRDAELSILTGIPVEEIKKLELCGPDSIRIFDGEELPKTQQEYEELYKDFGYLNVIGYLRTLMYTSVAKRAAQLYKALLNTKNAHCLDFGAGVGSHTIALLENDCTVDCLDVEGPLQQFVMRRVEHRFEDHCASFLPHDADLPNAQYDFVICADVLEHVFDPIAELNRIIDSMKVGGKLHLEVSTMIKPSSGHFSPSIEKWKAKGPRLLKRRLKSLEPTMFERIA